MSDMTTGEAMEGSQGGTEKAPLSRAYEAPKLTRLGNARELLAGNAGSVTDVMPTPRNPRQLGT